jgi:hypothetical protein
MMGYPVSRKSQGTVGAYRVICKNNGHGCCELLLGPCLVHFKIPSFFTLSITSIFGRMHGAVNIDKKITNCIV